MHIEEFHHRCGNQPVAILHAHGPDSSTSTPCHSSSCRAAHRDQWWTDAVVAALLPAKIRAVAIIRTVFRAKALLRSPRLNQRAVHLEMFVTHKALGKVVHFGKELLRHIGSQQPIAFFENTAWFQTASSMPRPINQRNKRFQSICSTRSRSVRTK